MPGLSCVIDQVEIPEERERRKAVTCSDECHKKLLEHRRKRKDTKICRQCYRPSTPEERTLYQRWRRETEPAPKKGRPLAIDPEVLAATEDYVQKMVATMSQIGELPSNWNDEMMTEMIQKVAAYPQGLRNMVKKPKKPRKPKVEQLQPDEAQTEASA